MSEGRNFAADGMKEFGAALGIDAGNGMLSSGNSRAGVWSGLGTINQGDASERHLRMECLKIATRHGSAGGEQDVHIAKQYYAFISGRNEKGEALKAPGHLTAILEIADALGVPVRECDRSQEQRG